MGSIFKRGKTWYLSLYINGKRFRRPVGRSKNRAQKALDIIEGKYRLGLLGIEELDPTLTVGTVAKDYLEFLKKSKPLRYYKTDANEWKNHLKLWFSNVPIARLTNKHIDSYRAEKKSQGYANATVNIHIGILRRIITKAKEWHNIQNINLKFPMFHTPQKAHHYLSPDEYYNLEAHLPDNIKDRVIIHRGTGMRPGEIYMLTWGDVDIKLRIVKIRAKSGWNPKWLKERNIPMTEGVFQAFQRLHQKRKSAWVFANSKGKSIKSIRKSLEKAVREAGIEKQVTPNMLRHTFGTHLMLTGTSDRILADLMGHADPSTTRRYTHTIIEYLRTHIDKLENLRHKIDTTKETEIKKLP